MLSKREQNPHSKRGDNTMMPKLGTFFGLEFFSERHFVRKPREIIQNKTNQGTIKKTKRNSRLLKMEIFCEVMF